MNRTLTIALFAALAGTASAQVSLTSYAPPPGIVYGSLKSLTPDGSAGVGSGQTPGGTTMPLRWTAANGVSQLTSNINWHDGGAQCVTADANSIYGFIRFADLRYKMVSWINNTRTEYTNLPAGLSEICPQAMDAAAANIFGWVTLSSGGDIKAARIKPGTQDYVLLDQTFANNTLSARSYVCDASDNGLVATGNSWIASNSQPVRWTLTPNGTSTMQALGLLPGGASGFANGASSDGSVIVGRGATANGDRPWQWRSSTGMVALDLLPGDQFGAASNISANARVAVGFAHNGITEQGRFWVNGEVQDFAAYMQARGVNMAGWTQTYLNATNNDGSIVTGSGKLNGNYRIFVAHIRCMADLDFDASVDLADFFAFFNAFDTSAIAADINNDSVVDLVDFFEFLNHFDAGC